MLSRFILRRQMNRRYETREFVRFSLAQAEIFIPFRPGAGARSVRPDRMSRADDDSHVGTFFRRTCALSTLSLPLSCPTPVGCSTGRPASSARRTVCTRPVYFPRYVRHGALGAVRNSHGSGRIPFSPCSVRPLNINTGEFRGQPGKIFTN